MGKNRSFFKKNFLLISKDEYFLQVIRHASEKTLCETSKRILFAAESIRLLEKRYAKPARFERNFTGLKVN